MGQQAEAMLPAAGRYNQRTEDNLSRLISGVDKLAHELPKRLAAAQQAESGEPASTKKENDAEGRDERWLGKNNAGRGLRRGRRKNLIPKITSGRWWLLRLLECVVYEIHSARNGGQ